MFKTRKRKLTAVALVTTTIGGAAFGLYHRYKNTEQ